MRRRQGPQWSSAQTSPVVQGEIMFNSWAEAHRAVARHIRAICTVAAMFFVSPVFAWVIGIDPIPAGVYAAWIFGAVLVLLVGLMPTRPVTESRSDKKVQNYKFFAEIFVSVTLLLLAVTWALGLYFSAIA